MQQENWDNWQYNNTKQNFNATMAIKTDFQNDFHINFPLQTSTLVGFDYRRNDYKELNTWGQTLPFNPPFNLLATQSQHTSSDFIQPFVTYGYLLDQRFDFGKLWRYYSRPAEGLLFQLWSRFKAIYLSTL